MTVTSVNSRLNQYARVVARMVCVGAWVWGGLALRLWPGAPGWLSMLLALGYAGGLVWWWRRGSKQWRWVGVAIAFVLVRTAWALLQPSNERDWVDYNGRIPRAEFAGGNVVIHNMRAATWRTASDYDLRWEDRTYTLDQLATVDFVVSPFALKGALAHTLLCFGFDDGEHIAVSVEIRKEQGEAYSPIKGVFRHYEMMYVIGEETDVLGLRTHVFKDPVYVFPIRASREEVRALFETTLKDASHLAEHPEFYNSLVNTCHLRILQHVDALRTHKIGFNWRNYLPGYSDELALELGLIDFKGDLAAARQRFQINERSEPMANPKAWSAQIREKQAGN